MRSLWPIGLSVKSRFTIGLLAALVVWSAGPRAQTTINSLIQNAPVASTPLNANDLFLLLQAGVVKKLPEGIAAGALSPNLSGSPPATLPLGPADSLVVVQSGVNKLLQSIYTLGPLGGLTLTGGATVGSLVVSAGGSITAPRFSIDSLGNLGAVTATLSPTLRPRNPVGGSFVFYVDAFDKKLKVLGWLGTVTTLGQP